MNAVIGIDIGTSCVKVIALSGNGEVMATGRGELKTILPFPGHAQQNPLDWWTATQTAIGQILEKISGIEIKGIGISGQMLGSVLMDKEGQTIEDCIIWMDQRAYEECNDIEALLGRNRILEVTSNDPLVSYWAPKILWLKRHKPDVYRKISKVLFPKDYLKHMLTGVYDIDVTDASGTMLFNTKERKWSKELFDALSIPYGFVPDKVSESTDIIGYVTEEAADFLGISGKIPVVAGGGDQMCGAIGLGIVEKGRVAAMIGTSGCVFSYSDKCMADYGENALLSYCHSVPGAWCVYGCTLSAGGAYQWVNESLYEGKRTFEEMNCLAAVAAPGCEGLLFLPYLYGERTPHPDPCARGVFFGLSARHTNADIYRSVMEGVTYSLRDTIEILREQGTEVMQVCAAGGGAKSRLWLQIQADIFGVPVVTLNVKEAPATGAAMLAAVGTGIYQNLKEAADAVVKVEMQVEPDMERCACYNDYYKVFRKMYDVLKPLYAEQAEYVRKWVKRDEKV